MVVSLLALLAVSAAEPTAREILPSEVSESLTQALVVPGGRIVVLDWSGPQRCHVRSANVARPIDGSGRVAVKVTGQGCSGWGWVRLEVWAETAVTTRAVRAGEELSSATTLAEREIHSGRSLPAGMVLDMDSASGSRVAVGDPVKVVFLSGSVAIEMQGRRTTCIRARDCAVLPSGKHVEGRLDDSGRLLVEVPR
jgi:flagella basal body P-ring formation protein FlgA